jgi:branched-chain amino acid transport system substrate-binding protein
MLRPGLYASTIAACLGFAGPAVAQSTVYIPAILELSGAGAVSGTNFRDGMLIAIDEINAKGGLLGRKIETPILDTQSDASISRAQVQKVLDNKPYVILGPVFSGSVLVDMLLTQQAEIPEIVGGEAAAITQRNNPYVFRTSFGQQFSMPKIANYMREQRFRQGGPRHFRQGDERAQYQGDRRYLDRVRPGRFFGRCGQAQGR